jgi:hypothetical protein
MSDELDEERLNRRYGGAERNSRSLRGWLKANIEGVDETS